MNRFDRLRSISFEAQYSIKQSSTCIGELAEDSHRVADVAYNAEIIIDDLERQFKSATKLSSIDIKVLFLATALQCVRQYVFSNDKFRFTDKQGDMLIKSSLKGMIPKSIEEVLFESVPYDAISRGEAIKNIEFSTGLSGTTHRYRTLGHDPILGWVFGPVNIITNSLTKTDIINSYFVKDMHIVGLFPGGTPGVFYEAGRQIQRSPCVLPAAIAKQAIHFGSDYFTKQGLPIPLMGTLCPQAAKTMVMKYNGDMYGITRSILLVSLINEVIRCIHQLYYDGSLGKDTYEIRTRKIITYSNAIASSSNILYVAISKDLKKLDLGGILITLYRLLHDITFKKRIEQEFLEREFYNIVIGDTGGTFDEQKRF